MYNYALTMYKKIIRGRVLLSLKGGKMLMQITILCAALAILLTIIILFFIPDMMQMYRETQTDTDYGFDADINEAIVETKAAEQNFNYADGEFIDAAIYQWKAAEERLKSFLKTKRAG